MKSSFLAVALAFAACFTSTAAPIIREPGAIYLSDFGVKPLKAKLIGAASGYFDIGLTRYVGTLKYPQVVQVEAFGDEACRVRGNAQQGGVAAWVLHKDLEPMPDGLLANLKKSEERRQLVEGLIAKNEVAIGMTVDEVGRSLGKPQKRTNRADKNGTQQVWEFIKYELIPQSTYVPGNNTFISIPGGPKKPETVIVQNGGFATVYVKVPVGKLTVTFKDNIVESLDQSEGTLEGQGRFPSSLRRSMSSGRT